MAMLPARRILRNRRLGDPTREAETDCRYVVWMGEPGDGHGRLSRSQHSRSQHSRSHRSRSHRSRR
jgi:hypothetical protein